MNTAILETEIRNYMLEPSPPRRFEFGAAAYREVFGEYGDDDAIITWMESTLEPLLCEEWTIMDCDQMIDYIRSVADTLVGNPKINIGDDFLHKYIRAYMNSEVELTRNEFALRILVESTGITPMTLAEPMATQEMRVELDEIIEEVQENFNVGWEDEMIISIARELRS